MKELTNIDSGCWVYVLQNTVTHTYQVGMTGDMAKLTNEYNSVFTGSKRNSRTRLVHYRRFTDTLTALGYKLLLSQLPRQSLEVVVLKFNPQREDLAKLLTGT